MGGMPFLLSSRPTPSSNSCLTIVLLRDVQGRVCTFLSNSECLDLGITTPALPEKVRGHMVFVLGGVPGKSAHVKVMPITSTSKADGNYVPITPTPKKGYTIQLQLRNYLVWHNKGQGGLRQLRDYVRRRDSICEQEALYRATEKET